MSVEENIYFNRQKSMEQPSVFPKVSRVNLNDLMKKLKEEEKKTKRNSLTVFAAALSIVVIFGIVLTL
jgi:hypothetical protein